MPRGIPKEKWEAMQAALSVPVDTVTDAMVAEKADEPNGEPKQEPAKEGFVIFESAAEEPTPFDILVSGDYVRSYWTHDRKKLCFKVPADKAERFRLHAHVLSGRIKERG